MRSISSKTIHWFQRHLLSWYAKNKRDLPWRKTHDPYKILVSEVMLQQTQVDRVIPKYEAFVQAFPTVQILARAPLRKVIRFWSGLGYNRRAVNLHRAARMIVRDYRGKFPRDASVLQQLPGIGRYTAGAVCIFAFRKKSFAIDTNIRRVLSRWFFGLPKKQPRIDTLAQTIVPKDAWTWHHAMMDFGALVCTARGCSCPFRKKCCAYPKILSFDRSMIQSRKKRVPFHDSPRFFRGRIIEALRTPPHRTSISVLEKQLGRPLLVLVRQEVQRDSTSPALLCL